MSVTKQTTAESIHSRIATTIKIGKETETMNPKKSRMYPGTTSWNPFKGCRFDCSYCKPSFQLQAKRQKWNCDECYRYDPHDHPERLSKIPSHETIFVAGNADISFCKPSFVRRIIEAIKKHNSGRGKPKTFYFQSKRPEYFGQFTDEFPENVILLTTLETNRDRGYEKVSKNAPLPSERYRQFLALDYPRKVVTIEPVMDFDVATFSKWLINLNPSYVWLGFNSRPKAVALPEPSQEKMVALISILKKAGVEIRGKDLRGIAI